MISLSFPLFYFQRFRTRGQRTSQLVHASSKTDVVTYFTGKSGEMMIRNDSQYGINRLAALH